MRKFLALACLLAIMAWPALGQQPAAPTPSAPQALPPDAPSREQVLKLLDVDRMRKNLTSTADLLREQFRQNIQSQGGDPDELKIISDLIETIFNNISVDDMVNSVIPIYQRHFTASDIDAISAFNKSPAGEKAMKGQTEMLKEMLEAMQPEKAKALAAQPLPAGAPSREQMLKLFDAIEMRKNLLQMMGVARAQGVAIATETLKEHGHNPDAAGPAPENDYEKSIGPLLDLTILVYQRHFTASEIEAMTAFFQSPVGKKFQAAEPEIAAETVRSQEPVMKKAMETLFQKISELEAQRKAGASK